MVANAWSYSEGVLNDKKDIKEQQKESQTDSYNPLGAMVR